MIDEEKTFAEKGYYSSELVSGSAKPVWALCEGIDCQREEGRGRWVEFRRYSNLCRLCALKNSYMLKPEEYTEKLEHIDDDITFAEKGYKSTWLSSGSNKPVWAICSNPECEREGGRGRWVSFYQYRELCHLCANRTYEFRKKQTDSHISKNVGIDNPFYGREHTPETRLLMSYNHADFSLENHPSWQGGISFGKYCPEFNNIIKQYIRDKYNSCDYISGLKDYIYNQSRKLDVHHVDYNKMQGCDEHEWRLIPLSKKNHNRTNYNRPFWNTLFTYSLQYDDEYYNEGDKNFDVFSYINEHNTNIIGVN